MPVRFLLACVTWSLLHVLALAQVPGSVFVLDRFGNHAPGNAFERIDGVYMSGGRGFGCAGAGLPDGDYVFLITDPAGTVELTPEPLIDRTVRVVGGTMVAYLGRTHRVGQLGPCGAIHLRLSPFLPTPIPGGEYRLWLTRVQDYDPVLNPMFGFDPARSKSDSFRVGKLPAQSILRGHKFYDYDTNGVWNPNTEPLEVPVGGWRVELWRNGVLHRVTYTDQDGWYQFVRDRDGSTWELREISPNGFVNDSTAGATWRATTARTGTAVTNAEYVAGPEFGNVRYEVLVGAGRSLVFWTDPNFCEDDHECDDDDCDEPNCSSGCPYEHEHHHHAQSASSSGGGNDDEDDDDDDGDDDGDDLEDECVSGRDLLLGADPLWRQVLTTFQGGPVSLRRPISSDVPAISIFVPPPPPASFGNAFAKWRSYVSSPPNDHAGFLLSRQVAGALLNNRVGFMQGDVYVDRFQNGVLVPFQDLVAGAIGLLNQVGAGLTGPNDPYQALRAQMLGCTNEFGGINDTGDPAAPQIVYARSREPGRVSAALY